MNREIIYACRNFTENKEGYECIYLYGNGWPELYDLKNAVVHALGDRCIHLTVYEWIEGLVAAIRNHKLAEWKKIYHTCDYLVLEGMESLKGKTSTQKEMLELLDDRVKNKKPTMILSDQSCHEIPGFIPELIDCIGNFISFHICDAK